MAANVAAKSNQGSNSMSGTRMIFRLSDEDEGLDGAVALLDADLPGGSSESDTGALPDPSASSVDAVDLSEGCHHLEAEPDPVVAFDERSEAPFGDLEGARPGRSQGRASVAYLGMRGRGRRSGELRRSRRVLALGALGALVVLMVVIFVHPNRSASSVSWRVPTSAQGAALARSNRVAGPPGAPNLVRPGARHRERRLPTARVARRKMPTPVRPSNPSIVVGQPVPQITAVSDAPTPTPNPPEPAREAPPSVPTSTQSSSQGYAEFSFER